MSIDLDSLKNTFARYVTGVTVVSCLPDGEGARPVGITVNSFSSVSLDPPLVLWCIDRKSGVYELYREAGNFAVSILSADQQNYSERFSTPGRHDFKPDETEVWETGAPLLKGRLGGLDCRVEHRHDAGDHMVLVGRVLRHDYRDGSPLMYVGRNYEQGTVIKEE